MHFREARLQANAVHKVRLELAAKSITVQYLNYTLKCVYYIHEIGI